MGSERLSHMFAAQDPTYKKTSSSSKHDDQKPSSQHSLSHTSGTQPVSLSNGPKSSPSPMIKHKLKPNSKYQKLIKLCSRQLSYIETTLNAIESLSKSRNNNENEIFLLYRKRLDKVNTDVEHLRNSPAEQDHKHFDPIKNDIDQLMNDLQSYKMNNDDPNSTNTIDSLVGLPLDVSDSENDEE
jgi:hypothetical protein